MNNKRYCERFAGSDGPNDVERGKSNATSQPSQGLLQYYKNKVARMEKEFDNLTDMLENIKSTCDLSTELQTELNMRNEEVSRLQQVVSDLQIHLFREKEYCLKLSAENDRLKIQEFEDRKKINALLTITGVPNSEMLQVFSQNYKGEFIERKLPPRLQKWKDHETGNPKTKVHNQGESSERDKDMDPQILLLKNHSLAAQLEHHLCISKNQIQVLCKDRELALEERQIEKTRLQKQLDVLSSKLKQTQDSLYETSSKLVKCQQIFEKEKNIWNEEKDKFSRTIKVLRDQHDERYPDELGYPVSSVRCKKLRSCSDAEFMREQILEKEQLAASYQEQIIAMEAEINRLRERAQTCRKNFKEKMDKMCSQTLYLKNKYEDLDRRRQLEAEGFRTDIKMLRDRLKDLEKKLTKANLTNSFQPSEQQLLISARNTLNRARQLEKELLNMKSKMSIIDIND